MNKDQDLIFEAYTKSLTEGWEAGTSKAPKGKSFDMSRGGAPSNVDAARDGSGGRYRKTRPPSAQSNKTHSEMEEEEYENDALMVNGDEYIVQAEISGDDVEITTLFVYDREIDDHNEIDLGGISPQLRQDIEDSVLKDVHSEEEEDDNDQYAPEEAPEDDQFEGMEPEEDESLGDSSDFEDKAEKFADSIGDAELEYLVNLSGREFEILKGFLQDQMGYRDLGQYKLN